MHPDPFDTEPRLAAPMEGCRIAVCDVEKEFEIHRKQPCLALTSLTLSAEPGEFLSIVGPSGCGKTTLLRLIAGLETPSAGVVTLDGGPVDAVQQAQSVGMAFQDPSLLPWLTVRGNLALPFRLTRRPVDAARIDMLLSAFELEDFAAARPRHLSGGMKQRVALARALILRPRLILLDEPFGALDALTRADLNDELLRMRRRFPVTTIMATHSIEEALYLADRVLVLSGRPGRIVAEVTAPFAYPRARALRHSQAFQDRLAQISEHLRADRAAP